MIKSINLLYGPIDMYHRKMPSISPIMQLYIKKKSIWKIFQNFKTLCHFSSVIQRICYNILLTCIKSVGVVKSLIGLISSIQKYPIFTVAFAVSINIIKTRSRKLNRLRNKRLMVLFSKFGPWTTHIRITCLLVLCAYSLVLWLQGLW